MFRPGAAAAGNAIAAQRAIAEIDLSFFIARSPY
jgi:hypothetical protein